MENWSILKSATNQSADIFLFLLAVVQSQRTVKQTMVPPRRASKHGAYILVSDWLANCAKLLREPLPLSTAKFCSRTKKTAKAFNWTQSGVSSFAVRVDEVELTTRKNDSLEESNCVLAVTDTFINDECRTPRKRSERRIREMSLKMRHKLSLCIRLCDELCLEILFYWISLTKLVRISHTMRLKRHVHGRSRWSLLSRKNCSRREIVARLLCFVAAFRLTTSFIVL